MTITIAFVGTEVVTTYIQNVIGPHSLNQPMGFLRHPTNLSLSWFVRFVLLHGFGIAELSTLASSLALIAGLITAAFAFVATWRLDDDLDWRGYSLWVVTVSILSPIMWGQFMACFVIVFVGIANGSASRRTVIAAVGSYVILAAFGGLHGYPLNFLPEFAQAYFARNLRVLHVLPESVTVSLILLYLSCCWFVFDNKPLQSTRMSSTLARSRAGCSVGRSSAWRSAARIVRRGAPRAPSSRRCIASVGAVSSRSDRPDCTIQHPAATGVRARFARDHMELRSRLVGRK